MASTRESSPASDAGSTLIPMLSPTSKVKALLADFSDDSDEEIRGPVLGDARARLMQNLHKSPSKKNAISRRTQLQVTKEALSSTESSEEEEDVVAPRGRLAAAMQALAHPTSQETKPTTPPRKRLIARSGPAKSPSPGTSTASDAASEDSDVPITSRTRKIRASRSPATQSSPAQRPTSPSLFVSPAKNTRSADSASDSDDLPDTASSRFNTLLERKRKETQAREDAAEALRTKRAEERKKLQSSIEADDLEMSDGEGGRRLTQQAKPTRKASKKALEEMHRESQRLSRNQQLAHYATTKKKYSTKDFLKRFKPQAEGVKKEATPDLPAPSLAEPTSSSPAHHPGDDRNDTPPTSPPSLAEDSLKSQATTMEILQSAVDEDLPLLESEFPQRKVPRPENVDKGKGKSVGVAARPSPELEQPVTKKRQIRVRPTIIKSEQQISLDDSDSDLEIVETKQARLKVKLEAMFNKAPIQKTAEDQSLYALQMLAHLKSPGKQNGRRDQKSIMTTCELQMSLQQKARQQAAREREEKIEDLRRRGITVQSTEERQKDMAEVEDFIAKARQEADDLAKKEKAESRRERKENGEVDPLGDSSDDEDWQEKEEETEGKEAESGSDEDELSGSASGSGEEDGEDMDMDEVAGEVFGNALVDNEASETEDDRAGEEINLLPGDDFINDDNIDEEEEDAIPIVQTRRARNTHVISDDEDEPGQNMHTPLISRNMVSPQSNTESTSAPTSVLRSATKTFIPGITANGPVGLGLTQIFAGTMDDSQIEHSQSQVDQQPPETPLRNYNAMAFLRGDHAPSLPPFMPTMSEEATQAFPDSQIQQDRIAASQPLEGESQAIELNFTQSQVKAYDSFIDNSQASPFPVTQDVGFVDRTPIKGRFVDEPVSTVDTLVLHAVANTDILEESPAVKRKGKLRRRAPQVFSDDEEETPAVDVEEDLEINESVFDVMRKASRKKVVVEDFDKKNSKAKEMVEEQANESEDEYAGLGGASDDESDGEADEFVKAMIDDETAGQNVDKAKIAAFFADRERAKDEKDIEKLYKDITSGMMRRKRGADYDLSDSDDGGEARRRMKRKEFAKMRKALLADERIGKIASNPKREAFLRAIEDRGSDDDMDFLEDHPVQEESESQSQSQADSQIIPSSQPGDMGPPKRKRADESQEDERLPPHLRRTKPAKRPSNLSEIRESLSSLIEEQNSFSVPVDHGSDSEGDLEVEMEDEDDLAPQQEKNKENRDPFALRRTKASIIDRISLKRESSSNVSTSARMAFAAASNAPGFKVPALLRKATTNSSVTSNTSNGASTSVTERMAGGSGSDGIKRGGGKNSGVNYFARETERRAALAKNEARREKKRFKGAEGRRKAVGGLLSSGKFE